MSVPLMHSLQKGFRIENKSPIDKENIQSTMSKFYCFQFQVNSDNSEYILDDDECPLSILMNHPTSRGNFFFFLNYFTVFFILFVCFPHLFMIAFKFYNNCECLTCSHE